MLQKRTMADIHPVGDTGGIYLTTSLVLLFSLLIIAIVVVLGFIVFVTTKKTHGKFPKKIDRYRFLRELPSGGMSRIFNGKRTDGRLIVIKIPIESSPREETLAKFLEEGEILSKLQHPHIVGLEGYGRTRLNGAETGFIALEYVNGYTLDRLIKGGKTFSQQEASVIVASVADALAAVHRTGVCHRDISTHNIMITYEGNVLKKVKLIDFGIAKWEGSGEYTTKDMMKEHYASPEQINRETPDGRTDIFSLGAVFYELITGHRTFTNWNRKILPFDPISMGVNISRHKNKLIMKMLELNPKKRIQTASEVVRTIGVPPIGGPVYESLPNSHEIAFNKKSSAVSFKKWGVITGIILTILTAATILFTREESIDQRVALKENASIPKEPEQVHTTPGMNGKSERIVTGQIPGETQKLLKKPASKTFNPRQHIQTQLNKQRAPKKHRVNAYCPRCGKHLVGDSFRYCPYCKFLLPRQFR
jgi:serine/threonine protein kinase